MKNLNEIKKLYDKQLSIVSKLSVLFSTKWNKMFNPKKDIQIAIKNCEEAFGKKKAEYHFYSNLIEKLTDVYKQERNLLDDVEVEVSDEVYDILKSEQEKAFEICKTSETIDGVEEYYDPRTGVKITLVNGAFYEPERQK